MARYIDAELLEAEVFTPHIYDINRDDVIALIAEQPTADVVEVIRCSKCKYCDHLFPEKAKDEEPLEGWYCNLDNKWKMPDHFCSYGTRK